MKLIPLMEDHGGGWVHGDPRWLMDYRYMQRKLLFHHAFEIRDMMGGLCLICNLVSGNSDENDFMPS